MPSPEPCLPGPTRPKLLRLPPMDPPDLHQPRQPHLSSGTRRCGLADVCERRAACQAYRARVAVGERKSQYELPKTRSGLQSTLITISLAQVRRLAHVFFRAFWPRFGFFAAPNRIFWLFWVGWCGWYQPGPCRRRLQPRGPTSCCGRDRRCWPPAYSCF